MVDRVLHVGGVSKISVQGMREIKTAASTILGTVKGIGHGKEIVYAKLSTAAGSAAIGVGYLMVGPTAVANHGRRPVAITASIGAREVIFTIGASSAIQDQYAEGILVVECGTGSGYSYQIAGNPAWVVSSTAARVILKDGLETTLTSASLVTLIPNMYRNVTTKQDSAAIASNIAGVTLYSAALTDGGYVWLAKRGAFSARVEGTWVAGGALSAGSAAGTIGILASAIERQVGHAVNSASAAGGYGIVNLNL